MEARINTTFITPEEGFRSTYHDNMGDIAQRITEASQQPLKAIEIEYSMTNVVNNRENLMKAQKEFTDLDLTPLEGAAPLESMKLHRVYMIKNPRLLESIKRMHLTSINLFMCFLNDQFLSDFSDFLSNNNLLQEVDLSGNEFTPAGCKPLITALMKNKSVKELTLLGPSVADDAALNGWPELLLKNGTLKAVRITICVAKNATWPQDLAAALKENHTLEHISLKKAFGKPSLRLDTSQISTLCRSVPKKFEISDELTTEMGSKQLKFLKSNL